MTIGQMAQDLWPNWLLGICMILLVLNSKYRDMMRVEIPALIKVGRFLVLISVIRWLGFHFLASPEMIKGIKAMADLIPWQAVLGTPWEDACHGLPLAIISASCYARRFHPSGLTWSHARWYKWVEKPLLFMVMMAFASGHLYQGIWQALAISLYIPFSINMGTKYGFGTVMVGHIMYDMSTLLLFKWMAG
jgi:hypothetical protein